MNWFKPICRCTESFQVKSAQISIFGIPLWYTSNTPRTVISPSVHPGECWAFQGFPGYLVLKLNHNVYVTGFTMEHIPKSLSMNNRIDSAPKLFTVWVSNRQLFPIFLLIEHFLYCTSRVWNPKTTKSHSDSASTNTLKMARVFNISR